MSEFSLPPDFRTKVTKAYCPACGKDYEVPSNSVGKKAVCKKGCGLSFVVSYLKEEPSREYLAFLAGMEAMRAHIVREMESQSAFQTQQQSSLAQAQVRHLDASRQQGWLHAGAMVGLAAAFLGVDFSD